jgi:hypothetical protein
MTVSLFCQQIVNMTKATIWLSALMLAGGIATAQAPRDKQNVDKLCGCFEVEFKYAETFSPKEGYKYHDREEISGGTELVFPVESSDKRIVMQHLLIITDSMIIKHWREEWTYENTEQWIYTGDNTWKKIQLKPEEVKGKWTQTVWEVSDAPRYQGASQWITADGKTFWQNTVDAPLPRREYSVRSDYNILRRSNRLILREDGYAHEQDNQKVIRANGKDEVLVEEKGWNTYVRKDAAECAAGLAYWEKTKSYWTAVRHAWEAYMKEHKTVELKKTVDGKVMHDHLFALAKEYTSGKLKPAEVDTKVKAILNQFVGNDRSVAGN